MGGAKAGDITVAEVSVLHTKVTDVIQRGETAVIFIVLILIKPANDAEIIFRRLIYRHKINAYKQVLYPHTCVARICYSSPDRLVPRNRCHRLCRDPDCWARRPRWVSWHCRYAPPPLPLLRAPPLLHPGHVTPGQAGLCRHQNDCRSAYRSTERIICNDIMQAWIFDWYADPWLQKENHLALKPSSVCLEKINHLKSRTTCPHFLNERKCSKKEGECVGERDCLSSVMRAPGWQKRAAHRQGT